MNFNPNNRKNFERKVFHQLPQRELMAYWRENFPTSVIRERMGYNSGTAFYNLLKRLKLPTNVQRVREMILYRRSYRMKILLIKKFREKFSRILKCRCLVN